MGSAGPSGVRGAGPLMPGHLHGAALAVTLSLAVAAWRLHRGGAPRSSVHALRACTAVWTLTTAAIWPIASM